MQNDENQMDHFKLSIVKMIANGQKLLHLGVPLYYFLGSITKNEIKV